MSEHHVCDYPDCAREATTRIIEEPYESRSYTVHGLLGSQLPTALDACDEHRAVTHPGWWCRNHEEDLREQAARRDRQGAAT